MKIGFVKENKLAAFIIKKVIKTQKFQLHYETVSSQGLCFRILKNKHYGIKWIVLNVYKLTICLTLND